METKSIKIPASSNWTEIEILNNLIVGEGWKGFLGNIDDVSKVTVTISVMRESPCRKCAVCCSNLTFFDRLQISIHTKTLMMNKVCGFLRNDNTCDVYNNRPKLCLDWECGVFYERK